MALVRDTNDVTLFDAEGPHSVPFADKLTVARMIVAHIAKLMEQEHPHAPN